MNGDSWGQVKEGLKAYVGASNYTSWIEPLAISSVEGGVALFEVPSPFFGNYVSQNFGDQIIYHLNKSGALVERLRFLTTPANRPVKTPATSKPAAEAAAPAAKSDNSGLVSGLVKPT